MKGFSLLFKGIFLFPQGEGARKSAEVERGLTAFAKDEEQARGLAAKRLFTDLFEGEKQILAYKEKERRIQSWEDLLPFIRASRKDKEYCDYASYSEEEEEEKEEEAELTSSSDKLPSMDEKAEKELCALSPSLMEINSKHKEIGEFFAKHFPKGGEAGNFLASFFSLNPAFHKLFKQAEEKLSAGGFSDGILQEAACLLQDPFLRKAFLLAEEEIEKRERAKRQAATISRAFKLIFLT